MKNKLLVVTDLGSFKAFKVDEDGQYSKPRLELIEEYDTIAGREQLKDLTTDFGGRFPRSSSTGVSSDMSDGERHNIELEMRKRLIKQLAGTINGLILNEQYSSCYFAAGKEINRQILDELNPSARAKIEKNVPSNLTKLEKYDILKHFTGP